MQFFCRAGKVFFSCAHHPRSFPKQQKAKDELVPDVCVYAGPPPTPDKEVEDDILTVSHLPD